MLPFKPYHLLATIQISIKLEITNVPRRLTILSLMRDYDLVAACSIAATVCRYVSNNNFPYSVDTFTFSSTEYMVPVGSRTELGSE